MCRMTEGDEEEGTGGEEWSAWKAGRGEGSDRGRVCGGEGWVFTTV